MQMLLQFTCSTNKDLRTEPISTLVTPLISPVDPSFASLSGFVTSPPQSSFTHSVRRSMRNSVNLNSKAQGSHKKEVEERLFKEQVRYYSLTSTLPCTTAHISANSDVDQPQRLERNAAMTGDKL